MPTRRRNSVKRCTSRLPSSSSISFRRRSAQAFSIRPGWSMSFENSSFMRSEQRAQNFTFAISLLFAVLKAPTYNGSLLICGQEGTSGTFPFIRLYRLMDKLMLASEYGGLDAFDLVSISMVLRTKKDWPEQGASPIAPICRTTLV